MRWKNEIQSLFTDNHHLPISEIQQNVKREIKRLKTITGTSCPCSAIFNSGTNFVIRHAVLEPEIFICIYPILICAAASNR